MQQLWLLSGDVALNWNTIIGFDCCSLSFEAAHHGVGATGVGVHVGAGGDAVRRHAPQHLHHVVLVGDEALRDARAVRALPRAQQAPSLNIRGHNKKVQVSAARL